MKPFEIGVAPKNHGILIFHTWRTKIPEGIQVLQAAGGAVSALASKDTPAPVRSPDNVRFGLDSFRERCSITGVVVSEGMNGYCRVYINFESWDMWEAKNPGKERQEYWYQPGSAYQSFLRSFFSAEYQSAKVRMEGEKISLIFSDKFATGRVETKIVFVPAVGRSVHAEPICNYLKN